MVHIVIIQSSLNPKSRTAVVAKHTVEAFQQRGADVTLIDLREYTIPFCDARSLRSYFEEYPDVETVYNVLKTADAFVIGFPVYTYTISGVLKNFIDIMGGPFEDKYFGIIANAGGANGYMSSNDLISFMLYDFNATAIMPQVYSYKTHFEEGADGSFKLVGEKPMQKIYQMVEALLFKVKATQTLST